MFTTHHWKCAIADFRIKTCFTFDSFYKVLRKHVSWIGDVFEDHDFASTDTVREFNVNEWKFDTSAKTPKQEPDSMDCGVIALRVAEHYTRGAALQFAPDRPKLVVELYTQTIIP